MNRWNKVAFSVYLYWITSGIVGMVAFFLFDSLPEPIMWFTFQQTIISLSLVDFWLMAEGLFGVRFFMDTYFMLSWTMMIWGVLGGWYTWRISQVEELKEKLLHRLNNSQVYGMGRT